jgi:hypothetical protein
VAGGDYTARCPIFAQPGVIGRAELSPAREIQTVRDQDSLQPGQRGTKKLRDVYGDRLVCVRYRDDAARQRRLKTGELIVEEAPWRPERAARKGAAIVGVRVQFQEVSLRRQVKLAGRRWNPARRAWELRRDHALKLGLKERIENAKISISRNY